MDVWAADPMDTRESFRDERRDLLDLLRSLTADAWEAPTQAGAWTVKDVALHLLDGDLGRLSRGRDGDLTGLIPVGETATPLAVALAEKNERWVQAAGHLSRRVIQDLLRSTTDQLDDWTADLDLLDSAQVSWASDQPVPVWL